LARVVANRPQIIEQRIEIKIHHAGKVGADGGDLGEGSATTMIQRVGVDFPIRLESDEKEAGARLSRLPKIFIASSSKAIEQAREIKRRLDIAEIAQVTLWQDSIPLSEYILDGLRNFAATVDFAVVLFTGDDEMAETGALDPKEMKH